MALSDEDRQRIYEEERVRHEARAALRKRSFNRKGAPAVALLGVLLFGLFSWWFIGNFRRWEAAENVRQSPEATAALHAAQNTMASSADVLQIGNLIKAEVSSPHVWRFEFDAIYREDTGTLRHGTLICTASMMGYGDHSWDVRLSHP